MREGRILSKKKTHDEGPRGEKKSGEPKKKYYVHHSSKRLELLAVGNGSQNMDCDASEAAETLAGVSPMDIVEERGTVEENSTEQEFTFRVGMKVFLRLAFIDNGKVDRKLVKDARKDIRERY